MDASELRAPRHPIGVVEKRTGLSQHVLRAWERRYGAVRPRRAESGQRLYSDADVFRLRLLRRATEAGRSIRRVAGLSVEELSALVGEDRRLAAGAPAAAMQRDSEASPRAELVRPLLREALAAATAMDGPALRDILMRAVVALRPAELVEGVVSPLLGRIGALWADGELAPRQEHLVSVIVRQVLGWLLDTFRAGPEAPVLLATTLSGEVHEFGAMLAALAAADEGWRIVYLGPSLPAEEIAAAARRCGASVVAVSSVRAGDGAALVEEIGALRAELPDTCALVVGGAGAAGREAALETAGARPVPNLDALRALLRANDGA